ncbi:hypothetical protein [Litoribaculum gwangyangense]|uniref:Uncharacterized protein n=1 Tax=Litoribaculum gwangyangense TaxID=1130722 RepID=A0ABP9CMY5_9FLAO
MDLVLTTQDLEPLPKQVEEPIMTYSGFLNSSYKSIVKDNYNGKNTNSIFNIKQRIKNRNFTNCCSVGVALKLSVFLTLMILIFN